MAKCSVKGSKEQFQMRFFGFARLRYDMEENSFNGTSSEMDIVYYYYVMMCGYNPVSCDFVTLLKKQMWYIQI
jgi:hypothetical protein